METILIRIVNLFHGRFMLSNKKRNFDRFLFCSLLLSLLFYQCNIKSMTPKISIHYLGHSSFILQFDNGVSLLTDYGTSNAWGLDSPIHSYGDLKPDIVSYSHKNHIDHAGGKIPENVPNILSELDSIDLKGIKIIPIRTSELSLDEKSNTSYLITYKGCSILHLGDAQANIKNIDEEENRNHLKKIFPEKIDLLLMTIEGRTKFIDQAEAFIDFLKPKKVIPMHYWSKKYKMDFLSYLKDQNETANKQYLIQIKKEAKCSLDNNDGSKDSIQIISLEPASFKSSN